MDKIDNKNWPKENEWVYVSAESEFTGEFARLVNGIWRDNKGDKLKFNPTSIEQVLTVKDVIAMLENEPPNNFVSIMNLEYGESFPFDGITTHKNETCLS